MAETTWGHRPALDGLRTVAVYLVVVYHAGVAFLPGGFIGVDVFFVLSGYLVTQVILAEHAARGEVSLRRFYARRVRRLLPASLVMVLVVCVATMLVLPRLARVALVDDARASLLYVANWHFVRDATDYFADSVDSSPFLHMWSLAIEEQFYAVYPLVLLGLLAIARGHRRRVAVGLGAVAVVSLALQVAVAREQALLAYYGTHTRLYQLLAGATLAAAWTTRPAITGRRIGAVTTVALGCLVVAASSWIDVSASTRGLVATVLAVVIVVGVETAPTARIARVLSTAPVTYLGRISYGTYLWHWPIVVLVRPLGIDAPLPVLLVSGVGGTLVAALSHRLVEMPVRRSARLDRRTIVVTVTGLAIGAVCAAVIVAVPLRSDTRPVAAARRDALETTLPDLDRVLAEPVPTSLDTAATEPPPVDLAGCGADDPSACTLRDGGDVHVLLLGDSNADQLIPAFLTLAERYDLTFSASTRMGCPWQEDLTWVAEDQRLVDDCVQTRPQWYGPILEGLQPDVVVVSGVPRDDRADGSVYVADDSPGGVTGATERTAATITRNGATLVILEPLPYATFDPTVCLSGAATVGECAYEPPASPSATEVVYRALDEESNDVVSVDLDPLVCPAVEVCVPMLDEMLVFRNQFHVSNALLVDRADRIWTTMEEAGAFDRVG